MGNQWGQNGATETVGTSPGEWPYQGARRGKTVECHGDRTARSSRIQHPTTNHGG